jgi:splicing factor 3A subunit 1
VDKTATFVARNGQEFEARIRKNEINNPKFNFLNTGDPYHAYYQYKVKEIREGKPVETAAPAITTAAPAPPSGKPPPPSAPTSAPASLAQQQKQQEILKQLQQDIPQIPKEPPPDFEFIVDPPSISAMEL